MARTQYGLPGIYNSSPFTLSSGDGSALAVDENGKVLMGASTASIGAVQPNTYAVDDTAMPATPQMFPVGGEYRATPTTYTDGDATVTQTDVNGNEKVTLATSIAGEDIPNDVMKVEQRFSYLNIAAGQATTLVKSGVGFLHAIVFNGPATATNTTTVYDNTVASGTVIAIPLATAIVSPVTVIYDVTFSVGLTIITATANGANMTVVYR